VAGIDLDDLNQIFDVDADQISVLFATLAKSFLCGLHEEGSGETQGCKVE
jgi:hypothetical protein